MTKSIVENFCTIALFTNWMEQDVRVFVHSRSILDVNSGFNCATERYRRENGIVGFPTGEFIILMANELLILSFREFTAPPANGLKRKTFCQL